jgi:hypothetical protein
MQQRGSTGLRGAWVGQPNDYPHEIDRGGNQYVLQMRFR